MPSYCSTFESINSVPFIGDMEHFKPYFEITPTGSSFDVVIKVPSNCYFVEDSRSGAPVTGECGLSTDKHHTIELNQTPNCTNTEETLLNVTLNYTDDPNGVPLYIYIVDKSNGDATSGNKSKISVDE